jgi:hypothetical protein
VRRGDLNGLCKASSRRRRLRAGGSDIELVYWVWMFVVRILLCVLQIHDLLIGNDNDAKRVST